MVREILKIRTDNGLGNDNPTFKGIELTEYNAKFPRMGMPSLSATLMWATPLDDEWTRKDYVVLLGERFYIRHTPSGKKDKDDARYRHEIEFTSEFAEILGNTYFFDAVLPYADTYNKPCTNNTKFTFFGTIAELADRFNCALAYAGIGDSILNEKTNLTTLDEVVGDGYCVVLDPYGDYDPDKTYEFSFEDKTFWEAITDGYYENTKVPFERRGRKIIFGAVPVVVEHKFEYGHDNELLSVYHKNANAKVINRITMLGSSENIPYYYPNETEYGHISIAAKDGNNVLTSGMVEIANMTTLLSRLNADSFAVLRKYGGTGVGNAKVEKSGYTSAFGSDYFTQYTLGKYIQHNPDNTHNTYATWHVRAFFEVTQAGVVECQAVRGNFWIEGTTAPSAPIRLTDVVTPESLKTVEDKTQGIESVDYSSQLEKSGNLISFGYLPVGEYFFQFSIKIQNRGGDRNQPVTTVCFLSTVDIKPATTQKTGYYWEVGDKRYDGVGELGVKINGTITDAMIGDGFGWVASGRMPFQDHLIPPKYRDTLGDERFYNAINLNLVLNSESVIADAGVSDNFAHVGIYFGKTPHFVKGESFSFSVVGWENIQGSPTEYTIGIYNFTEKTMVVPWMSMSNGDKAVTGVVENVPTVEDANVYVVAYAGKFGETAGNKVKWKKVMVVRGAKPMEWRPSASECGLSEYVDPDTGNPYSFPNPFVAGAPSEHIFRDDDRKPTIEGVKNADGQLLSVIADIAYDADDNDVLKPDSEESDKNDSLKYEHSFFYIKLNIFNGDYGFNLFEHALQSDPMTIQMTSGNCNGCKFKIQVAKFTDSDGLETYKNPIVVNNGVAVGVVSEEGIKESDLDPTQQNTQTHSIWICVQKDASTFGVLMPNQSNNFKPAVGDKFNIINIDMPLSYWYAAEKRLEEDGIRAMADNNEEKFTFEIQASRIFLAENPDVLAQLDEYSVIKVKYNGRTYEQYVNQLTIDCKDSEALPNVGIELTDELTVGQSFVDNVAERAASLVANAVDFGGGSGGGLSAALAERRYLNKQKADRTPYPLNVGGMFTAEAGSRFGDFVHGQFTGRGGAIDGSGNAEVESIVVRSYMKVMELIYNRLNAQEGNTSFGDSGTIDVIFENPDGSCVAQLRSRWGGDFTAFQPGDVIYGYVNDINRADSKEYYKAWAWIKSVDRANNQLTIAEYPDSEVPSGTNHPMTEGMMITRWGNNIEPNEDTFGNPDYSAVIGKHSNGKYYNKRQRSFYISCDDGNLVELMGVNKPILEQGNYGTVLGVIPDGLLDPETEELINKDQPYLYARGIIVQDLIRIGYEGLKTRVANYRGLWNEQDANSDTDYYRNTDEMYDTVTWDGALWQNVVSGTTDEPSELSAAWVKMTATVNDGKEIRVWVINPSTNIVSVRKDEIIPKTLSATVTLNSSNAPTTVFSNNATLNDEGVELWYSADGVNWKVFAMGASEPLELEDESGVIELEDSVDDSLFLTVGGDDIDTRTIADRIYFELRSLEDGTVLTKTDVTVVKDGQDGEDGIAGRDGLMVYPAGNYDPNVTYSATDETMPVVMYNGNYYRLRAGVTYWGNAPTETYRNPADVYTHEPADTSRWILFDKFNSIFANIIMAEFAKLGSAVFVGEWMISQHGIRNGVASNEYQHFKDGSFEPDYAVNFETGEFTALNGTLKGHIDATSGTIGGFNIANGHIGTVATVENTGSGGMSLYQSFIKFSNSSGTHVAFVGENVLPAVTGSSAQARFENTETDEFGTNYGLVVKAKNAMNNIAVQAEGNVAVDGLCASYSYREVTMSENSVKHVPFDSNTYIVKCDVDGSHLALPDKSEVQGKLGISQTTPFSIRITIISDGANSRAFNVQGRNTVIKDSNDNAFLDNAKYPYRLQSDGEIETTRGLTLSAGNIVEYQLVYNGDTYKAYFLGRTS